MTLPPFDVLAFLEAVGWTYREHRDGEAWVAPCPFCGDGSDNPERQAKAGRGFSLNIGSGAFCCLSCGAKGHASELQRKFGTSGGSAGVGETSTAYRERPRSPEREPDPIPSLRFHRSQWERFPEGVEYAKARGFSKEAVLAFGLGWDGSRDALAIPTIGPNGDAVAWKYRLRAPGEGRPKYLRTAGAPSLLFGTHLLPTTPPYPPVVVTEGELDAVALWQFGVRPVVSIPSGAAAEWRPEWIKALDRFGQVFLAHDADEEGDKGAAKAVAALGAQRCKRVRFPRKDAAQCLADGIPVADIHRAVNEATPAWTPDFVLEAAAVHERAIEWLRHEATLPKVSTGIYDLDRAIGGGLVPGELTLIYGATAHGKSTLALSILVNALVAGVPCLSASLEYVEAHHWRLIAGQRLGKRGWEVTAADLSGAPWLADALGCRVLSSGRAYTEQEILATIGWASAQGVRLVVFDPLDYLVPENAQSHDYYGDVARYVRRLRDVITPLNLHVIVVCPVRKDGELAGRNTLKHDAWNLLHIERDTDKAGEAVAGTRKVVVTVEKARRTGVMGRRLDLVYVTASAKIASPQDHEGTGTPF